MRIEKIKIKGFRNFDNEEIFLQPKTLIIGANDVGKSNLLYALRLLFDKSLNEHDLELTDSDYNAYSRTENIEITVTICEITEDCLLSTFSGHVKDDTTVIRYTNSKNGQYSIWNGYDETVLEEQSTRQYIKRLNMQCVDTNRDLFVFLKRERMQILRMAKERLDKVEKEADDVGTVEIQKKLNDINSQVSSLNYVASALESVNAELSQLSIHNEDQKVKFVAGESDAEKLLDKLLLSYSSDEGPLAIGGDGRNNQIFLATWIAKQNIQKNIDHVTFFAVEEPEAHLHPHQQRKLSEYIQSKFGDQIIITTHSPHIAAKFEPDSIIRLYAVKKYTHVACGGCSQLLKTEFKKFGYRLNALSAEIFFANGVFLVEGVSEVLFYTALAQEIGVDLDRLNMSILAVEGVGFKPYVAICDALKIPWVLRTDNDIFSKPQKAPTKYYYAGISRLAGILSQIRNCDEPINQYWQQHKEENEWECHKDGPLTAKAVNEYFRKQAKIYGLYLSDVDLETDLAKSDLYADLKGYYKKRTPSTLIKAMQAHKAQNMMSFLTSEHTKLSKIQRSEVCSPLLALKKAVEEGSHPTHA